MRKRITKRLSILLALVMLFSLLPTLSAPVSAEPAPTAIDSVGVSLTRPVVGPSSGTEDGVPGEATITAGEHSSVEKVRWYKGEGEGIGLGDFDAFENGKQYFAEICLITRLYRIRLSVSPPIPARRWVSVSVRP